MSGYDTKGPPDYLREARIQAGYGNRGAASTIVPFSPETIGRHERGEAQIAPQDAVIYSDCYGAPAIMVRYCADCPVGIRTGRTATDRPLPLATLRIRHLIQEGQDVAGVLERIAFDGEIDQSERKDFENALTFLQKLDESITDIMLIGLDKRKGRSLVQQETAKCGDQLTGSSVTFSGPSVKEKRRKK